MKHPFPSRLLATLLKLYPPDVRRARGRDLETLYRVMWEESAARSLLRSVMFRGRLILDLVWNALLFWASQTARGGSKHGEETRRTSGLAVAALGEIKVAARRLVKTPAFSLLATLTLALGIAANTVVFALIHGVYLEPLPFPNPDRLVYLQESDDRTDLNTSFEAYEYFRDHTASFEGLGAYSAFATFLRQGDDMVRARGAMVSANLFSILGVQPAQGRDFLAEEDDPGAAPTVILSYGMWQTFFGGRTDVLGAKLGRNTVVGVMPPGFHFPDGKVQFWITLRGATRGQPSSRYLTMVGRLAPGSTMAGTGDEVMRVGRRLEVDNDPAKGGEFTRVHLLEDRLVDPSFKSTFRALAVAVAFLLLIAAANLTNLLLARASRRKPEVALRKALGASAARLTLMGIAEPVLLAVAGGVAGVAGGYWGMRLILNLAPMTIPRQANVRLSPSVLVFALGISLLAGLAIGLTSLSGTRTQGLSQGLPSGGRVSRGRPLQSGFTVAQVSLTFALLAGVILMAKTVMNLQGVNLGFSPENAFAVDLPLAGYRYPNPTSRLAFYDRVVEEAGALPGAVAAGYATYMPLTGSWADTPVRLEGNPGTVEEPPVFEYDLVSPGFFGAMGIALRGGRLFNGRDREGSLAVALVNETAARLYFPNGMALGRRLAFRTDGEPEWRTVVGVVDDVRNHDLRQAATPKFYIPFPQYGQPWPYGLNLVIRTKGLEPSGVPEMIRRMIRDMGAGVSLVEISPLQTRVDGLLQGPRFNTFLLGVFTFSALALAALGLYGVVAFGVAERRREIGLRMALGADATRVRREILWRGLKLTLIGVALGIPLALGMGRVMTSMLFGVGSYEPGVLASVVLLMVGVSATACILPSSRASRVDPIESLRLE